MNFTPTKPLNGYTLIEALNKRQIDDNWLLNHYVPDFKGFGTKMNSNLSGRGKKDTNASLHFIWTKGKAVISDFGYKTGMSVFSYLSEYLGVPVETVYERVNTDFNLKLIGSTTTKAKPSQMPQKPLKNPTEKVEFDIRYRGRDWGTWKVDAEFWGAGGIRFETLERLNVVPATDFWVISSEYENHYKATNENPTYIYLPDKSLNIKGYKRKAYSPYGDENRKWKNTLPHRAVLALHTLPSTGDTLLIQTSLKDTACCMELFEGEDIWNVDLFSESIFLPKPILDNLKLRFKRLIIFGDNDEPGIKQASKFSELYGIPFTHFDLEVKEKDPYGMVRSKGQDYTKREMLRLVALAFK